MLISLFDIEIKDLPSLKTFYRNTVNTTVIFIKGWYSPKKTPILSRSLI